MIVHRTMTVNQFRDYVEAVQLCGEHPLRELTVDVLASVAEVLCARYETKMKTSYEDTHGDVLVRLVNGTTGHFFGWSNSSMHSRQCDARWVVYSTEEEAYKAVPRLLMTILGEATGLSS